MDPYLKQLPMDPYYRLITNINYASSAGSYDNNIEAGNAQIWFGTADYKILVVFHHYHNNNLT